MKHDKMKIQGEEKEAMDNQSKSFFNQSEELRREILKEAGIEAKKLQDEILKEYDRTIEQNLL
jgi:vacuolar-type H+-ATPase subunit H